MGKGVLVDAAEAEIVDLPAESATRSICPCAEADFHRLIGKGGPSDTSPDLCCLIGYISFASAYRVRACGRERAVVCGEARSDIYQVVRHRC